MDKFERLQNAPASMFKNITPKEETPANGTPAAATGITGEVTEQASFDAAKDTTINSILPGSSNATAVPGSPAPITGNQQSLGNLLGAKTAIGIVDSILPAIAVIALQYFFDLKIQKRELQLNENERGIIAPVLQNYLDSVFINFDSPLQALLITVGAVYGSKFAEKGFTSYFDKRDATAEEKKRVAEINKETRTRFVPDEKKTTPVVNLNKQTVADVSEPDPRNTMTATGFTVGEMQDERKLLIAQGKRPNNNTVAFSIKKKRGLV